MTTFQIELPWPPTGNTATRHTRSGAHYTTAASRAYRAVVRQMVLGLCAGSSMPLKGPLSVSWLFCPPDRRGRDVDNHRKVLADALTEAGLWLDDSNKVIRRETFEWTDPEPGGKVFVSITQ